MQDIRLDPNKAFYHVNIERQFSGSGSWRAFALLTSAHNSSHQKLDIPDSDPFAALYLALEGSLWCLSPCAIPSTTLVFILAPPGLE